MCKIETRELIMVRFGRMCRALSPDEAAELRHQQNERRLAAVQLSPFYDEPSDDTELDILPPSEKLRLSKLWWDDPYFDMRARQPWRKGARHPYNTEEREIRRARRHTHRQMDGSWFNEMASDALEVGDFQHLDAALAFATE